MNRFHIPVSFVAGFMALTYLPFVKAESAPDGLSDSLRACMDEPDDVRRLACFDREVAGHSPSEAVAPATPEPEETASLEEKFGIAPERQKEDELMELEATVVKVSFGANRIFTVWLDNDQIWRQKYTGTFHINAGDSVSIKKGNFGGYSLKRRGRRVSVNRIQ